MQSSGVILFYEKCRLCLDKVGACDITKTEHLKQDIFACTGVKVSPSDNLPQKICATCLEIVHNAKELRSLAIKNDKHLRSLFSNDSDEETNLIIAEDPDDHRAEEMTVDTTNSEPEVTKRSPDKNRKKKKRRRSSKDPKDDSDQTTASKSLKVRKDLFDVSSSSTNLSLVVKTKKEYESIKRKLTAEDKAERVAYKCEVCKKDFETWKKLYLHLRSHNKKLACPLDACGKKFATKGDLEKHLRTHTGVRPFVCGVCDKSFTQHVTLKAHKENVHYDFTLTPNVE